MQGFDEVSSGVNVKADVQVERYNGLVISGADLVSVIVGVNVFVFDNAIAFIVLVFHHWERGRELGVLLIVLEGGWLRCWEIRVIEVI